MSGVFWGRLVESRPQEAGWEAVSGWGCFYTHPALGLILSGYVDDFKMAGREGNLAKGWATITKHLRLDPPTMLGDYLGRGQRDITLSPQEAQKRVDNAYFLISGDPPPAASGGA